MKKPIMITRYKKKLWKLHKTNPNAIIYTHNSVDKTLVLDPAGATSDERDFVRSQRHRCGKQEADK